MESRPRTASLRARLAAASRWPGRTSPPGPRPPGRRCTPSRMRSVRGAGRTCSRRARATSPAGHVLGAAHLDRRHGDEVREGDGDQWFLQVLAVSTASRITPPAGIVMASAWGRMVSEKAAITIGNRRMDSDLATRPPTSAPSSPDAPTRPYARPYAVEPNPSTVRTMVGKPTSAYPVTRKLSAAQINTRCRT